MKGFWERTRRLSNTISTYSHSGYHDLKEDGVDKDEGVILLNLDFQDLEIESPISRKSSVGGFEAQDVIGGGQEVVDITDSDDKKPQNLVIATAIQDIGDGSTTSGSDDDDAQSTTFRTGERKPLVKPNMAE